MISILLAAYQSEALLKKVFFKGLAKHTRVPFEVILYDNGGNGDLKSQAIDLTVIGDGENVGLNQALNACAASAKYDYFYLPHTDMYLMPGWDLALLEVANSLSSDSFLLCSRSVEPTKGHTDFHIIRDYGSSADGFDEKKLIEDFRQHQDPAIVTGYRMPFFLHRKLWNKMGGVDPHYFSYCTDDDLVQTAYDQGVRRFGMVMGSLVYHLQGKSNQSQEVDRNSEWPYEYFIKKWKQKYPDASEPSTWHPRLIPWYQRVK